MGRELTGRERAVLSLMISSANAGPDSPPLTSELRRQLQVQLSSARAGRSCGCSTCPSIEIEIENENGHTPSTGTPIALDADVSGALLLLFIVDGQLSYLELAPLGDEPFLEFPDAAAIFL